MAKCDGCGAEATRIKTTYDKNFRIVGASCNVCRPEEFAEKFSDPTDRVIHEGSYAYPHLYKMGSDGVLRAKDELIADTWDQWERSPQEDAENEKRRTRNTTPMTPAEIAAAKAWGEKVLKPQLQARRKQLLG
jgi:alkylhydroperoxidase/carboxymuconolactone decarboxylase family protein YurZ